MISFGIVYRPPPFFFGFSTLFQHDKIIIIIITVCGGFLFFFWTFCSNTISTTVDLWYCDCVERNVQRYNVVIEIIILLKEGESVPSSVVLKVVHYMAAFLGSCCCQWGFVSWLFPWGSFTIRRHQADIEIRCQTPMHSDVVDLFFVFFFPNNKQKCCRYKHGMA